MTNFNYTVLFKLSAQRFAGRVCLSTLLFVSIATVTHAEKDDQAIRDVLSTKESDSGKSTVLEDTLTATDQRYSLMASGKFSAIYDFSYSYIGEQLIEADFTEDDLSNFSITNTQGHTFRNVLSLEYGVLDNLTVNTSVPMVTKYSDTDDVDGDANAIGDVSVGVRLEPFPAGRDWPTVTFSATGSFPTGRSPFDSSTRELSTGSGNAAITAGINVSKVIDPVAVFGSLNYTYNLEEDGLDFILDDYVLEEVQAGNGIGWGMGFAYAMSYNITTTMSFQQYFQTGTELFLVDDLGDKLKRKTGDQTSAILNMGIGVRLRNTTLNFSVGAGLTPDSPDFILGLNVPLRF